MELHSGCGGDFEKACLYKKISKEVYFTNLRGISIVSIEKRQSASLVYVAHTRLERSGITWCF